MTAGRTVNSLSQHWCTPAKYVKAVKQALGGEIALDPCSNKWSIVAAKTAWALPKDGLRQMWNYQSIYVNPPYGADRDRGTRISDWLAKCAEAHLEHASEVIALVPVAANTKHWKDSVWAKATSVCFLYDTRLRFLEGGSDTGKGAPMACAAVYWGHFPSKFANSFQEHGAVVSLGGVNLPRAWKREKQLVLFETQKAPPPRVRRSTRKAA